MPPDEEKKDEIIIDHWPDDRHAVLHPHGTRIRVKSAKGHIIYELTPKGWMFVRQEDEEQ